ncbi:MAG: ribose-phosphate diphosphokinase [Candidatus Pacearchaeota archaeon]
MASENYVIIADPEGAGWGFAKAIFDNLRVMSEQFELSEILIKEFHDGELKPKIKENIRGKKCFFIHDSNKHPLRWFTELCLVNQALKKSSASEIVDVLPYMRFARQDRKDESRVPINAEVVADIIELYADGVLTLDVHNPAIDGFFKKRFDNLYSFSTVVKYLKENCPEIMHNLVIMTPDAGGAGRASAFAKKIGIKDVAVGYKVRRDAGIVDELRIVGDVNGKNVLIIDDIIDSGGTLIKASETARKMGANKVYAYCTHGLFTKGVETVLPHFDKFFVGDSIKQHQRNNLEVISFVKLFSEAIYRMCKGMSLSALFDKEPN